MPNGGRTWAVEFDGPAHFLACGRSPKGGTLLKHRHLQLLGYALVVVQYWEWDQVSGDEASKAEYLRGKLDASCMGAQAAASRCRMAHADEPSAAGAARKDRNLGEEERMAGKRRASSDALEARKSVHPILTSWLPEERPSPGPIARLRSAVPRGPV